MMEKAFSITALKKIINHLLEEKEHIRLYLFGSALTCNNPTDIDILVTYDSYKISVEKIIEFRKKMKSEIRAEIGKEADICLLSLKEEERVRFIESEHCSQILF